LSKADTGNLLRQISEDRALGSQLLFSHRHPQETPKFHVQVMDLWRGADEFVLIEAFREAGKSTLSEEFLLLEACFGNFRYALVFGETYTKAVQRLSAIKHEALRNTKLHALFGKLKGEIWSENAIVLANGCRIEAHGWEEEIRGYKWLDARPDRAYLDDIENKSMVRDTASVDASWRKLNTELIPALDKEHRKVRVTGTPLADDCLVNRCKKSPEWVKFLTPASARRRISGDNLGDITPPSARKAFSPSLDVIAPIVASVATPPKLSASDKSAPDAAPWASTPPGMAAVGKVPAKLPAACHPVLVFSPRRTLLYAATSVDLGNPIFSPKSSSVWPTCVLPSQEAILSSGFSAPLIKPSIAESLPPDARCPLTDASITWSGVSSGNSSIVPSARCACLLIEWGFRSCRSE
jgi:hypothetical protein